MKSLILCGGLGTRLRSVVSDLPKCLAPVKGKPFLYYLLKRLEGQNFDEVVLCASYMADKIYECFGNRLGKLKISYDIQSKPTGTGAALRKAAKALPNGTNRVLVINGDTYWPIRYHEIIAYHVKLQAKVTIGAYNDIIAGTFVCDVSFLKSMRKKHFEDNFPAVGIFDSKVPFLDIGTPENYLRAQFVL